MEHSTPLRHRVRLMLGALLGAALLLAGASTAQAADPVVVAAGDIACSPTHQYFNGGDGSSTYCHQKWTSEKVISLSPTAVLPLGDDQYICAGAPELAGSYDPTWGRLNSVVRPIPGNHEYYKTGGAGCDASGFAAPYFQYFASVLASMPATASDPAKGYYSYDVGTWHIVALNTADKCIAVGCGAGSAQEQWLRADLAAHQNVCTLAYLHYPTFSSKTPLPQYTQAFWNALYDGGVDVALMGHVHHYERFAPQSATGAPDPQYGIREFVVGTGGMSLENFGAVATNSEKRIKNFGVLALTLHPTGYTWNFVNDGRNGNTATDSGTDTCHGRPGTSDTTHPAVNLTAPANGATVAATTTVSANAQDDTAIQNVQFAIDGTVFATDSSSPYSTQWDTTSIGNGPHLVTAIATDTSGNQTTSAAVSVTVDNDIQAPGVSVSSPVDGAVVSGSSLLQASASDNVEVTSVDFRVDGVVVGSDSTAPYTFDWDSTSVVNGSHAISALAHDAAGNTGASTAVNVTVSNTVAAPTVSITAPAGGDTVGSQITVSATASSAAGITSVEFRVDGVALATDTTSPYSVAWNTATAVNGAHTLTAVATGGDSQQTTSPPVNVTVFNDTTLPDVNVTAPTDGQTVGGSFNLTANASDNVQVQSVTFKVDNATVGTDTTAPYSVTWQSTGVANGPHTVTAIATDTSGNQRTSTAVNITVQNTAPAGITRRGFATSSGTSGNPAITIPAATQAGDVIVVAVGTSRSSTSFSTPPAGWTLLPTSQASDFSAAVYIHVAQTGEAGSTVAFPTSSSTDYWTIGALVYTGVDPTNPVIDTTAASPSGQVQSVQPPAIAMPTAAMAVAFAAADVSSARTWTEDAGNEIFDIQPSAITLVANDQTLTTPTTLTRTLTISGGTQELTGYLIALNPAS